MTQEVLIALSLVLVLEGILPFLAPDQWREAMIRALSLNNRSLRLIGLASMLAGIFLLYLVH